VTAQFVIDAYHWLFQIESRSGCPDTTCKLDRSITTQRDSIEAHLTIVFAAWPSAAGSEERTGWSIRKFVHTACRYRTVEIQAGTHTITAAHPLPDDLHHAC
jgi:hypothetical protein